MASRDDLRDAHLAELVAAVGGNLDVTLAEAELTLSLDRPPGRDVADIVDQAHDADRGRP
jgi:hypothetical protein